MRTFWAWLSALLLGVSWLVVYAVSGEDVHMIMSGIFIAASIVIASMWSDRE